MCLISVICVFLPFPAPFCQTYFIVRHAQGLLVSEGFAELIMLIRSIRSLSPKLYWINLARMKTEITTKHHSSEKINVLRESKNLLVRGGGEKV